MKEKILVLRKNNFILIPSDNVQLGTNFPLECNLEKFRKNETPIRIYKQKSFWINKYCVTNIEYEKFHKNHHRPESSKKDLHPVTDITYLNAILYCNWLSKKMNIKISLPTESEWIHSAAPFGWEYPWGNSPSRQNAHIFYPNSKGPLEVNSTKHKPNFRDLYHMSGNVQEYTLGTYYSNGHCGSTTDGMYCIIKGGDWKHCKKSVGVQRRGLIDVSARAETIGFRITAHL